MYRIGLNLFNKKPEKGLNFLIKQGFVDDAPNVISNFLVTRKGISRQVIGEFLGNGSEKSKKILKAVCNQIDLSNLDIDEALRKFQAHIRIQVNFIISKSLNHFFHTNIAIRYFEISLKIKYFRPRTSWNVIFFCKMDSKDLPENWLISTFYSIFQSKIILSKVRLRLKMQSTRHKI
jgi:hypothetical protein